MTIGLATKLDYGHYCAIPPDGKRYEVIDGELHVMPAPSPVHQRTVLRFARTLQDYFGTRAEVFVSPIDVILGPHDIVQPDIAVVANAAQISERGIEGPPLLVVEVLSPTTTVYDRSIKSQRYAALGVLHYWIVDPATRSVDCYRREGSVYLGVASAAGAPALAHPDFPDLRLPLVHLWS